MASLSGSGTFTPGNRSDTIPLNRGTSKKRNLGRLTSMMDLQRNEPPHDMVRKTSPLNPTSGHTPGARVTHRVCFVGLRLTVIQLTSSHFPLPLIKPEAPAKSLKHPISTQILGTLSRLYFIWSSSAFCVYYLNTKMSSGRSGSERFRFPAARSTATTARMP